MSSSNNNDNSGIAIAIGLIVAAAYALAIFFVALMVILAVVFTVIAIAAWKRPLRIGKWVVTPAEAHDFVNRGLYGMWGLPLAAALCDIFFETRLISAEHWHYWMIAGYTLGSVGVEMLLDSDGEREPGPLIEYLPPQQQMRELPPAPKSLPAPAKEPFRFASWDDEA